MDELESIMLSKISQSEKDRYHMWNLGIKTDEHSGGDKREKEREANHGMDS